MASLTEEWMAPELGTGRLLPLLKDWSPPSSAFYLYHPSRVQMLATLRAFIDMARQSQSEGNSEMATPILPPVRSGAARPARHRSRRRTCAQ
jgi:hypothetical protein